MNNHQRQVAIYLDESLKGEASSNLGEWMSIQSSKSVISIFNDSQNKFKTLYECIKGRFLILFPSVTIMQPQVEAYEMMGKLLSNLHQPITLKDMSELPEQIVLYIQEIFLSKLSGWEQWMLKQMSLSMKRVNDGYQIFGSQQFQSIEINERQVRMMPDEHLLRISLVKAQFIDENRERINSGEMLNFPIDEYQSESHFLRKEMGSETSKYNESKDNAEKAKIGLQLSELQSKYIQIIPKYIEDVLKNGFLSFSRTQSTFKIRKGAKQIDVHYCSADPLFCRKVLQSIAHFISARMLKIGVKSEDWILVPGGHGDSEKRLRKTFEQIPQYIKQHEFEKLINPGQDKEAKETISLPMFLERTKEMPEGSIPLRFLSQELSEK